MLSSQAVITGPLSKLRASPVVRGCFSPHGLMHKRTSEQQPSVSCLGQKDTGHTHWTEVNIAVSGKVDLVWVRIAAFLWSPVEKPFSDYRDRNLLIGKVTEQGADYLKSEAMCRHSDPTCISTQGFLHSLEQEAALNTEHKPLQL